MSFAKSSPITASAPRAFNSATTSESNLPAVFEGFNTPMGVSSCFNNDFYPLAHLCEYGVEISRDLSFGHVHGYHRPL